MDPLTAMLNARKANVRAQGGIQSHGAQDMASILQQQQLNRGSIGARMDGPAPTMVTQDPNYYPDRKQARDFQVLDAIQARKDAALRQGQADQQAMLRQKQADANALSRLGIGNENATNLQNLADYRASERDLLAAQKAQARLVEGNRLALGQIDKKNEFDIARFKAEQKASYDNALNLQDASFAKKLLQEAHQLKIRNEQFAAVAPAVEQAIKAKYTWGKGDVNNPGSRLYFEKKALQEAHRSLASNEFQHADIDAEWKKDLEGKEGALGIVPSIDNEPPAGMIPRNSPHWDKYVQAMLARNPDQQRALLQRAKQLANEQLRTQDASITTTYNTSMALMKDAGFSLPGNPSITASNPLIPGGGGGGGSPDMDPAAVINPPKDPKQEGLRTSLGLTVNDQAVDDSALAMMVDKGQKVLDYYNDPKEGKDRMLEDGMTAASLAVIAKGVDMSTHMRGGGTWKGKSFNVATFQQGGGDKAMREFQKHLDDAMLDKNGKPLTKFQQPLREGTAKFKTERLAKMDEISSKHGVHRGNDFWTKNHDALDGKPIKSPADFQKVLAQEKGGVIKRLIKKGYKLPYQKGPDGRPLQDDDGKKKLRKPGAVVKGGLVVTSAFVFMDIKDWYQALPDNEAKAAEKDVQELGNLMNVEADLEDLEVNSSIDSNQSQIAELQELAGGGNSTENNVTALTTPSPPTAPPAVDANQAALTPPPVAPPVDTNQTVASPVDTNQTALTPGNIQPANKAEEVVNRVVVKQLGDFLDADAGITGLRFKAPHTEFGRGSIIGFNFRSGGLYYRGNANAESGEILDLTKHSINIEEGKEEIDMNGESVLKREIGR